MQLVVVGDTVLARKPRADLSAPVRPGGSALPLLARGDVTIANLETPLTDSPDPAEKEAIISVPTSTGRHLREIGIDVVSLATNHGMDHGPAGLRSTIAALDDAGIRHAGGGTTLADAEAGTVLETPDGGRLTVLSFCCTLPPGANATATRPGIAPIRISQSFAFDGPMMQEQPGTPPIIRSAAHEEEVQRAEQRIREAKATSDRVVICLHWGVPWCYLPETQGPLAQYQQPLGRRLVEAGADVVVGTHPHCLHPVERWHDGLIIYSAGNFLFHADAATFGSRESYLTLPYQHSRLFSGPWFDSAVFEIDLRDGAAPTLRLTPVTLDPGGEPLIADADTAARILRSVEQYCREINPAARITPDGAVVFA